ncbi:MAG: DUF3710 domain-containing protein [Candidatus Nanopelagicales bacterium]
MFRRRRRAGEDDAPTAAEQDEAYEDDAYEDDAYDESDDEAAYEDDDAEDGDEDAGAAARTGGPWDESEVDLEDGTARLDLGSLVVAGVQGMELQVQVDEGTGALVAVTAVLGTSAVQVQPFAAPKSAGIWADVRAEIRGAISGSGGTVDEVEGPFGVELRTKVPAQQPDGKSGVQPARFVGVDGPRWFLRGVFLGQAATDPDAAGPIEDVFRSIVIVRGPEAMAPGDPLPLRLPQEGDGQAEAPAGAERPPLNPFQRGPEITEIR